MNLKLVYSIPNILKNYIKKGKDQLDFLLHQAGVYKIYCDDCDASYVDQIKRKLKTRLQEHKSDIRKRSLLTTKLITTTNSIGIK